MTGLLPSPSGRWDSGNVGDRMKVLVVGAGIAGPTLAYWLLRAGHEVTLLEHSPELRRGGYVVDFWGAGFEVAERMGIVPELRRRGYTQSGDAADGRAEGTRSGDGPQLPGCGRATAVHPGLSRSEMEQRAAENHRPGHLARPAPSQQNGRYGR